MKKPPKMPLSSRRGGIVYLVGMAAGIGLVSVALGQTPSATPPAKSGQIGPGASGSISPAQGVSGTTGDAAHKKLDGALTPKTRQTLQEAMDSAASTPSAKSSTDSAVTIGPGEGAQMDGSKVDKVALKSLPAPVKNALDGDTHKTLSGGAAEK